MKKELPISASSRFLLLHLYFRARQLVIKVIQNGLFLALLIATLGCKEQETVSNPVTIEVKPTKVFIERDDHNQYLNFDFILKNNSAEDFVLNTIEVSVFDEQSKLAYRNFVNLYSRSSLELVENDVIEPEQLKLLYNPFAVFDTLIPLHKLQYTFSFLSENGKENYVTTVNVFPQFYQTKTKLILPLKGRLLVWDGHDLQSHHRRFDYTAPAFRKRGSTKNYQRYGYDFVVVDEAGTMYKGEPKIHINWYDGDHDNNSDYYGFGTAVYATGDGIIADARDGAEDDRTVDEAAIQKNEKAYGGNYVIIDHQNGEFSWLGHLKKGSIKVKSGQKVKQGEIIGAMGASGSSLFPHLHYELRDGDGANQVEGLPSYFSNYIKVLGSEQLKVEKGLVNTGDILQNN